MAPGKEIQRGLSQRGSNTVAASRSSNGETPLAAEPAPDVPISKAELRFARAGQLFVSAVVPDALRSRRKCDLEVQGSRHGVAVSSTDGSHLYVRMVGQRIPKTVRVTWNTCQTKIGRELQISSVAIADEAPDLESRFFESAAKYFAALPHPNTMTSFSSGRLALLAGGLVSQSRWTYPRPNELSPAAGYYKHILPTHTADGHALQRARGAGVRPRPKVERDVAWSDLKSPELVLPIFPPVHENETHRFTTLSRHIPNDVVMIGGRDLARISGVFDAWFVPNSGLLNPLRDGWTPRTIVSRYLDELMLSMLVEEPTSFSVLTPLVSEWALVYDDPFFERGTSVGVIVRSERISDLLHWLSSARQFSMRMDASVLEGRWIHDTITVRQYTGGASERTQHVAIQGDRIYIANRRTFLRRLLNASGTSSAMNTASDYRWVNSQLNAPADLGSGVHWFVPSRFWHKTVMPKHRISIWRRAEARAELESVSLAALLYRWLQGELPSKSTDMVRMGLLAPEELQHKNGDAIKYHPIRGVSSTWGSLLAMKPLSDILLAPPTQSEMTAYERFSRELRDIAPEFPSAGGYVRSDKMRTSEALIFPAPELLGADELHGLFGEPQVTAQSIRGGVQVTFGLNSTSDLRRMLSTVVPPPLHLLDWAGQWASLGLIHRDDKPVSLAHLESVKAAAKSPVSEWSAEQFGLLRTAPWFIRVHIARPLALADALANTRKALSSIDGLEVDYRRGQVYRNIQSIHVSVKKAQEVLPFELYYAIVDDILVIAQSSNILAAVVESCLDQRGAPADVKTVGVSLDMAWGTESLRAFMLSLGEFVRNATSTATSANTHVGVRNGAEARVWLGVPRNIMIPIENTNRTTNSKLTEVPSSNQLNAWKRALDAYSGLGIGLGILEVGTRGNVQHAVRVNMKWSAR